ncbi:MAG: hypothetical protein AB1424_01400 [Thermodesulfobacteriota bacterium]
MRKATFLILAMAVLIGSGLALAQQKTPGQAQEHEKHHPPQQATQPQQPGMGPGMMGGQGMMCPCMMMPQMMQHMQKMMPMMEQIVKEKKMSPEATKQMQEMMTQMQGMMTHMQKMPMMQMMQQQKQPEPQKQEKK